jgi:hypothetical protein
MVHAKEENIPPWHVPMYLCKWVWKLLLYKIKKLSPYTLALAGFDLMSHRSSLSSDTTKPSRQEIKNNSFRFSLTINEIKLFQNQPFFNVPRNAKEYTSRSFTTAVPLVERAVVSINMQMKMSHLGLTATADGMTGEGIKKMKWRAQTSVNV